MRLRVGLLASLSLLGCSAAAELASQRGAAPCFTAEDCGGERICIANECVPNTAVGPETVHVEIAPPSSSPFARTQLLDASAIGGVLNLSVPKPTEFAVIVLNDDRPIGATLVAFGAMRIPDREVDLTQAINADALNPSTVRLEPGSYGVRLIPDNRELPGFEALDFTARSSPERQTKEFLVPAAYRTLSGRVVSSVAGTSTLAGVEIRAVGLRSGLPSTSDVSDEDGNYELLLPDTGETSFLLTAVPPEDGPAWSFEQVIQVGAAEDREKRIELELTNQDLRGLARIKILGSGPNGPEPVRNASVTLTATTTSGLDTRVFEVSGVTDADGFITVSSGPGGSTTEIPILRGHYLVDVRTPSRSPYASTMAERDLSNATLTTVLSEQVELGLKTRLTGTVISASGRPVGGALIQLRPLSEEGGRTLDTETQFDGSFVTDVDPGRYLVVVEPPITLDQELLPAHAIDVRIEQGARFDLPPINLPRGTRVSGTVTGEESGPIRDARVEFFVRAGGETISIAKTISDAAGAYSVVLPDQRR